MTVTVRFGADLPSKAGVGPGIARASSKRGRWRIELASGPRGTAAHYYRGKEIRDSTGLVAAKMAVGSFERHLMALGTEGVVLELAAWPLPAEIAAAVSELGAYAPVLASCAGHAAARERERG